jgi:hypothetical protein
MHDGTCLVTFVAGVSFLLLMELNRLGAFSAVSQALNAEFAPRKAVAAQVHLGPVQAGRKPVAASMSTAAPAATSSEIVPSGTDSVSNDSSVVHVADGRVGPHRTRTRDRATDRT